MASVGRNPRRCATGLGPPLPQCPRRPETKLLKTKAKSRKQRDLGRLAGQMRESNTFLQMAAKESSDNLLLCEIHERAFQIEEKGLNPFVMVTDRFWALARMNLRLGNPSA